MAEIVALRHLAFEDVGLLGALLAGRGHSLSYVDVPTVDLTHFDPLSPDLLIVLGGPIGVNDENLFPYLAAEKQLIKQRLEAGLPLLGICLGAQLMAAALGAKIYPGVEKEIGWKKLTLSEAGQTSALSEISHSQNVVLHWHGDTFDLPEGATLLASSDICSQQAFSYGPAALALQFHLEAGGADMENWFVGHISEISSEGLDVVALRGDNIRWTPSLTQAGRAVFDRWLNEVGL
ncbi:MAG: glutamine amidotransferase [Parvibaculaceae bacterium]|nr:glutamine amidotransferase [Parvibaculaceae bacterium]